MKINDPRRNIFDIFQDEYKEYILTDDEIWYGNLEKLKKFIDENKKTPSQKSPDKDIKQLGMWLGTQKKNYKNQIHSMKINDTRRNVFEIFQDEYKEYILTDDEIWYENLEKLKKFIDNNKKTPSNSSNDKNKKQPARWLNQQKLNYKRQIRSMKINDPRRNVFENFITEYKQHFKNFELNIIEIQDKKDEPQNDNQNNVEIHTDIDKYTLTKLRELSKEYKIPNYKKYKSENKNELVKLLKDKINNIPENTQQGFGIFIPQQLPNESQTTFDIVKPGPTPLQNMLKIEENKQEKEETNNENSTNKKQKNMYIFKPKQINKKTTNNNNIQQPILSPISKLHKKYKSMKSSNLAKHFTEDNGKYWKEYHELVQQNEQTYQQDKIPVNQVIQYLETKKNKRIKKVADLGCGLARIYKYFQNKNHKFTFVNIDHFIPEDQSSYCIQGNIKNTELEDEDVDYSVLCLALWGSDYKEYLTEIHRILDIQGELIIVEPSSRWIKEDVQTGERTNELKSLLEKNHFKIKQVQDKEKFMFIVCEKL
jgi:SAM-dependent methyltransferase